jgi:hypothetical protein
VSSISVGRLLERGWMLLVKDEKSVKSVNAYTFCLDKSG